MSTLHCIYLRTAAALAPLVRIQTRIWYALRTVTDPTIRPIVTPAVALVDRMNEPRRHRAALADLMLADRLDKAGLSDTAERLRAIAAHRSRTRELSP